MRLGSCFTLLVCDAVCHQSVVWMHHAATLYCSYVGVLVEAMRQGHWVILDELNLAPTEVLEALNRVRNAALHGGWSLLWRVCSTALFVL